MRGRDDEHPGEPWVHGVAARFELLEAGVGKRAIEHRIGSGRYLRIYEGVYDLRDHGTPRTRSDVEAAFLQLCIDHRLPRPQVNRSENGVEQDFRFPDHNLIVEVDGYTYHRDRRAFANDRARDREALRRGQRTARFPADEIVSTPAAVAQELQALLNLT